jgi:hypothetical protein
VSLKPLLVRTYDRTDEENAAIAKAELEKWNAGLKKEAEPKPAYTEKEQKWAMGMLTGPSQAEMNVPDDYRRHLVKLSKSQSAKTGSTSRSSASTKRDVPQLEKQAKQNISPLKVDSVPSELYGSVSHQRKLEFAAECGISLSQVEGKGSEVGVAPSAFNYVKGGPMIRPGVAQEDIPTQLRKLNKWCERVTKKDERTSFLFLAGPDHFLGQHYSIPIYMEELFRFFNLRDIDISIVSCYTL